jgi:hypothetical protein
LKKLLQKNDFRRFPLFEIFALMLDHNFKYGPCLVMQVRAAQVVPACQPGCEKMERECENEEEMERE